MSLAVEPGRLLVDGEWVEPGAGSLRRRQSGDRGGHRPGAGGQRRSRRWTPPRRPRQAFQSWSRTTPEHRAEILDRVADLLVKRGDEIIPLLQAETGATMRVASTMQVPVAVDRFRRYARERDAARHDPAAAVGDERRPRSLPGGLIGAVAIRQPVGVVACITPYNFPLVNMAGKIAPALAMGNTVVVKPAPQDPLHILRFGELLLEAGIPPGVVNIVGGSGAAAGAALTSSPDVDMVSFTGSTAGGPDHRPGLRRRHEAPAARARRQGRGDRLRGRRRRPRRSAASPAPGPSTPGRSAPRRPGSLVHRSKRDELVAKLAGVRRRAEGRRSAGGRHGRRAADHRHPARPGRGADRRRRRTPGAELVAGGGRPDLETGFYVKPTLLTEVAPDNPAAQEEFFGPVVVVLTFDDEDEAVELANGTQFGLYDYVYTGDTAPRLPGRPPAAHRHGRRQHRAAQPRGAVRRASR